MYSLFVSGPANDVAKGSLVIPRDRFLEYTTGTIREQLATLSREAVACLSSWPCLVMHEGRGSELAHLVKITGISRRGSELVVGVSQPLNSEALVNAALWERKDALHIEQFEFSRTHWAVKNLNTPVLATALDLPESDFERFEFSPLPGPPRSRLFAVRDAISDWGHTEIDDLVLEIGIGDLGADRSLGSRRDRANAILQYVLANPGAVTAERSLLSAFLARKVSESGQAPAGYDSTPAAGALVSPQADREAEVGDPGGAEPDRVFVVHGHDGDMRDDVVAYLRSVALEPIVLHEQANMGQHLLTKFVREAKLATFAVVLLTDDDVGGKGPKSLRPRARQNVILELGYFLSHLGQARVCALMKPGVETPSDFDGIVYIPIAADENWKVELRRELVAANLPVAN